MIDNFFKSLLNWSKNRIYLCLFAGNVAQELPRGLADVNQQKTNHVNNLNRRWKQSFCPQMLTYLRFLLERLTISNFLNRSGDGKTAKKSRKWILDKKERQRRQGKYVNLVFFCSIRMQPKLIFVYQTKGSTPGHEIYGQIAA